MMATTIASLLPDGKNEGPAPDTDGRSERRTVRASCAGSRGTEYPLGDKEMGSVQGGGIQTGGWLACLDEVSQDLEDLRGVGDHGDNLHRVATTRTA